MFYLLTTSFHSAMLFTFYPLSLLECKMALILCFFNHMFHVFRICKQIIICCKLSNNITIRLRYCLHRPSTCWILLAIINSFHHKCNSIKITTLILTLNRTIWPPHHPLDRSHLRSRRKIWKWSTNWDNRRVSCVDNCHLSIHPIIIHRQITLSPTHM